MTIGHYFMIAAVWLFTPSLVSAILAGANAATAWYVGIGAAVGVMSVLMFKWIAGLAL